jgi:hypothetical protein
MLPGGSGLHPFSRLPGGMQGAIPFPLASRVSISELLGIRRSRNPCPLKGLNQMLRLGLPFLGILCSPIEEFLYRRAYRLILAVNAANPAAWPADPFLEFTYGPLDVLLPRFVLLDGGNPTNPLIAS